MAFTEPGIFIEMRLSQFLKASGPICVSSFGNFTDFKCVQLANASASITLTLLGIFIYSNPVCEKTEFFISVSELLSITRFRLRQLLKACVSIFMTESRISISSR